MVLISRRKRAADHGDAALSFMQDIESSWKGHEHFAFWLVRMLRPKVVVDLGFDRGFSTLAFAYRNRGHVYGVDWFDEGKYALKCFVLDSAFRNISNALRFNYVKNVHLIVGTYVDILKTWKRKIDILHVGMSFTSQLTCHHYENWGRFLNPDGVILIHDVKNIPREIRDYFEENAWHKVVFPEGKGLEVICKNEEVYKQILEFAKFSDNVGNSLNA